MLAFFIFYIMFYLIKTCTTTIYSLAEIIMKMGAFKQNFGIKFPFTCNNNDELFVDLNVNGDEKIASQIAHLILTPKNTRIRMPDFGTDLIKYIFSPNDEELWDDIKEHIITSVNKYINNVTLNNINVLRDENNDNAIYVSLDYDVKTGSIINNNKMMIKI